MLDVIQQFQLTCIFHSPPVFLLFTQPGFPREKIKSVWYAMSGSAPLSKGLQERVSAQLFDGAKLSTNWGMTEVVAVATMVPTGMGENDGSVGTLLPGMEGRIVDTMTGKDVGVGERGELLVRGIALRCLVHGRSQCDAGILRNSEANAAALENWLHTGTLRSSMNKVDSILSTD